MFISLILSICFSILVDIPNSSLVFFLPKDYFCNKINLDAL